MPLPTDHSNEVTFFIRVSSEEGMDSFLSDRGIQVQRSHGAFNNITDIAKTVAENPAPFIMITGLAHAILQAFSAYAKTHKKRITIRDKHGNKIDATNYSVDELKELNPINLIDVSDDNDKSDSAKSRTD